MSFARAVEATDYLRFVPGGGQQREWLHFVVHAPDLQLLVNFSVVEVERVARGHVIVLVRDASNCAWDGDVERVALEPRSIGTGRIRLVVGRASLSFDGAFHIEAECRRRAISVSMSVAPRSFPFLVHNLALPRGGSLHWLVAPRLEATGSVSWNGRRHSFTAAPAYHDHNWGRFNGDQLAWEWGCALADGDQPWSAVLVRVLTHGRAEAIAQGLLFWKGAHRRLSFRGRELTLSSQGLLRARRPICVPRALSLLAPGSATDVPTRLTMRASSPTAKVDGVFECQSVARVLVPRDVDLATTAIHEVVGTWSLSGEVDGEALSMRAPAVGEFLGEAR